MAQAPHALNRAQSRFSVWGERGLFRLKVTLIPAERGVVPLELWSL